MPKHLLVVDDDPSIRDLITTAFSGPECVVDVADGYDQCFQKLRKRRPDLVLLDVQMPGRDGLETLRAIRADNTLRHVPVVMLTAKRSEKHVREAQDMRVIDYVGKPINLLQLAKRVDRLLHAADEAPIWEV